METLPRYEFEVLLTRGDWRMVRAIDPRVNYPKRGRWVIIQHRCGGGSGMYSVGEWSFCTWTNRSCAMCQATEPPEIQGFHDLFMWDNKEDLL